MAFGIAKPSCRKPSVIAGRDRTIHSASTNRVDMSSELMTGFGGRGMSRGRGIPGINSASSHRYLKPPFAHLARLAHGAAVGSEVSDLGDLGRLIGKYAVALRLRRFDDALNGLQK